jgi:hypothetical protein
VESHTLAGTTARALRSPELLRLVRSVWEDQRRFPLQIATVLSQQFAAHGLQFFKVNRTVTHVCVARPHYLDLEATPVSEGVKRIVEFINAHSKCNRRQLVEALAPSPTPSVPTTPSAEGAPAPVGTASPEPTAEQTAVIADLHWLIHQGHVIEFANGLLETAKKPVPKPPKPQPKPAEAAPVQIPEAPQVVEASPPDSNIEQTAPPAEPTSATPDSLPAPSAEHVEAPPPVEQLSQETVPHTEESPTPPPVEPEPAPAATQP